MFDLIKKIAFLKDMLGETIGTIDNEKLFMEGAAAGGEAEAEMLHCENIARLRRRELSIQYLIDRLEEIKDAKDFFGVKTETLLRIEKEVNLLRHAEREAQTEYVDLLDDLLREIVRVWTKNKYMITRMSIINRLNKEEFRVLYTEEERPCADAFLDKIKDCCGEECTRFFIVLDNNLKALEDLRAKTGDSIIMTENTTFNCTELVFFDENKDNDYYL
jgi:hypothetical protein